MKRITIGLLLAALAGGVTSVTTLATGSLFFWKDRPRHFQFPLNTRSFQRVATLGNYLNNGSDAGRETVSEIIAATANGRTLVYTDAVRGTIGFIDITRPSSPRPLGVLNLDANPGDDVTHSPTSVDVLGNRYALVAVDTTSGDFAHPSGHLVVVDISNPSAPVAVGAPIDLGGQPDSVKISPDERFVAIAIENQRNEDLCVGGGFDGTEADEDDCVAGGGALGVLPQGPAGFLAVIALNGPPASWVRRDVQLTGLARYAPGDPEPEFVDVNSRNEAVVTLQENNHVAVVDLATRRVKSHFPAGAVTLQGVDAVEDGVMALTDTLRNVVREPDAVAWVPGLLGTYQIATANEGDLFGGSRGFSLFRSNGAVAYDSGTSVEEIAVQHGHYPEGRSDAKGTEPEAIVYARFGFEDYLFVGSERGNFVAVYTLDLLGRPRFDQLLPAPMGPEGLLAIPERNLLVVSGEVDLEGVAARSNVMIYQLKPGPPLYPQILSDDSDGSPIPWSALSGMAAVPWRQNSLLAVWDAAYTKSAILQIDASETPAIVTGSMTIEPGTIGTGNYDPEGIAVAPDQTMWVASEGNATDTVPNRLLKLDSQGHVLAEIGLPANIVACRAATAGAVARRTLGSGFEGIAVLPGPGNRYRLAVAQQRGWNYTTPACEALDDDGGGFNALGEPNWTRIWIYDPAANTWGHVAWELAPLTPDAAWTGLSEITVLTGGALMLVERDNLTGDFAGLKTLARVGANAATDGVIHHGEKSVYDLLPHLLATNGWITDKVEGAAVTPSGRVFVSTDNDGLDDWSGETWFFGLGRLQQLFD
jgi:DNA-binding beta-propeller fold protein YncE